MANETKQEKLATDVDDVSVCPGRFDRALNADQRSVRARLGECLT
jgi:hypothetical protein